MKWMIETTDQEDQALFDLTEKQDLTPEKIFIQALRLYQGVVEGAFKIVETNPSPGCGIIE